MQIDSVDAATRDDNVLLDHGNREDPSFALR